jgi:hypothetical protein
MVSRPKRKTARKSAAKAKAKHKAKSRPRPRGKVAPPPAGPVTLAEARGMTMAKKPALAVRKAAAPAATPQALGLERKRLEKARQSEFDRRTREYESTMKIMKARGARAPSSKPKGKGKGKAGGGAAPAAHAGGFMPLQIFAEGDSWFDYPIPFFGGGIVPRLEDELGVPILNLAKAGDEVRFMLGVAERKLLIERLTEGCPAGGPWDALLFSGGGNDIVDDPMALWVKDWNPAVPAEQHINQPRFGAALALVKAGFDDLISLRDTLSPNTHLIFHGYDFAIPDGRRACGFLGPWLKPTFELRKFPDQAAGQAVVKAMLLQFADMLTELAKQPRVTFVNTQGTLAPKPSSWDNELHPSRNGFDLVTRKIADAIRVLFPQRVA